MITGEQLLRYIREEDTVPGGSPGEVSRWGTSPGVLISRWVRSLPDKEREECHQALLSLLRTKLSSDFVTTTVDESEFVTLVYVIHQVKLKDAIPILQEYALSPRFQIQSRLCQCRVLAGLIDLGADLPASFWLPFVSSEPVQALAFTGYCKAGGDVSIVLPTFRDRVLLPTRIIWGLERHPEVLSSAWRESLGGLLPQLNPEIQESIRGWLDHFDLEEYHLWSSGHNDGL